MLAARDKRTGKFLKSFSGSLNHFEWNTEYRLTITRKLPLEPGQTWHKYETVHKPSREEVHAAMFCLPNADGAKLYATKAGAADSFYSYRWRANRDEFGNRIGGYNSLPLAEALPWLELVDVQTFERRRAAARKGAATRRKASKSKAKRRKVKAA